MSKKLSISDLQEQMNLLPITEVMRILDGYSEATHLSINEVKGHLIKDDLQRHLEENGINTVCPYCGSEEYSRNGFNGNVRRFKCKACKKSFTSFTNTILEKTKYPWEVWVEMIYSAFSNKDLEQIRSVLEKDYHLAGIDVKTVFLWRHKIMHAIASLPMPTLNGVVEVDETYFRESQKGSRKLVSLLKDTKREPRYGREASRYGIMGNEFANVVVAIDSNKYCVSKVIGMGKLTVETFTDLFDEHMGDVEFLCTDKNNVYQKYSSVKNIPHYVKPSTFFNIIKAAGVKIPKKGTTLTEKEMASNKRILAKLYNKGEIDEILNYDKLSYDEFLTVKRTMGLNLARVNGFHSILKEKIECGTRAVSTKYLADYVGFLTYMKNWETSHGYEAASHEDAEAILLDILKGHTKYTTADLKKADIPKHRATEAYMKLLKKNTMDIRTRRKYKYFKYDEEDNVTSFNKREFLLDLPDYKLKKLCSYYKIPHTYARYCKVSLLLKEPDIGAQILRLIRESRSSLISQEDIKELEAIQYAIEHPKKKTSP